MLVVGSGENSQQTKLAKKVRFGTIAKPYIAIVLWSGHLYLLFHTFGYAMVARFVLAPLPVHMRAPLFNI